MSAVPQFDIAYCMLPVRTERRSLRKRAIGVKVAADHVVIVDVRSIGAGVREWIQRRLSPKTVKYAAVGLLLQSLLHRWGIRVTGAWLERSASMRSYLQLA